MTERPTTKFGRTRAEQRRLLIDAGLCERCHQARGESKCGTLCEPCYERDKTRRANRNLRGICVECQNANEGKYLRCRVCRERAKARLKALGAHRLASKLCLRCGERPAKYTKYCDLCCANIRESRWRIVSERALKGLCAQCGKYPYLLRARGNASSANHCQRCYLMRAARTNLGSSKYGPLLAELLAAQEGRCVYSGEEIILGQNDAVDHILPRSRFPERAIDPSNVQWVTRRVNDMKRDMTHDEFLAEVARIHARANNKQPTPTRATEID